jgi:tripeptide aminopeptidase
VIDEQRLLSTFLDLVRIESPSGEEDEFAAALERRLNGLGAAVKRDSYGNLVADIGPAAEPFLIAAHMDTVEPGRGIKPIVEANVVRTDGSTVLGGDPKSGVAAVLEGLTAVKAAGGDLPALQLVFTRREESGLEGSANLDYSLVRARRGVEFDGEGAVSNVTIEAPGRISAQIEFVGRGAHAGVEPEKGISAIQMAARFIAGFPQGRIDAQTTANIGLVAGGSAANAVPEHARLTAEARSRSPSRLEAVREQILGLVEEVRSAFPGGRVEYELREEFSGYKMPADHPVVATVSEALRRSGLEPALISSGGATDANNFARHGIEVVVVGLGGQDFHTVRESISIPALNDAARFCFELLRGLARRQSP